MPSSFEKIAIVTGTTSGIGLAIAKRFIAEGYAVVGNGRTTSKLEALEAEFGPAFHGVAGDAADQAVIDQLFAAAKSHFGAAANIVVVNAGRGLGGTVTSADLSQLDEMLRINVAGATRLMQTASKQMQADLPARPFPDHAHDIVVIGSVVGRHISEISAVYGATKFAVNALAEALRRDVAEKGIRVSLIEPGFILSGFQEAAGYSGDLVAGIKEKYGPILEGAHVADIVHFTVSRPPHMHVSDMLLRPTRQVYP